LCPGNTTSRDDERLKAAAIAVESGDDDPKHRCGIATAAQCLLQSVDKHPRIDFRRQNDCARRNTTSRRSRSTPTEACSERAIRNKSCLFTGNETPRRYCPGVLWYIVVIGAFITIAFVWMLHMELKSQILLSGITAFFLAIMIFLIYTMDRPLQGAVSVPPDSFSSVYDSVMKWDERW
jgi:hypothetical protein